MTDESEIFHSGPSDDATDITKSVKRYTARSVFEVSIRRIQAILEMVETGIQHNTNLRSELLIKLSNAQLRSNVDNEVDKIELMEDGTVEVRFTLPERDVITEALTYRRKFVEELPFYVHNVLLVAAWGALEGYVQALLAELYTEHPNLLSSEKKVTFAEIIGAGENLIAYLVAKEIDDVGRKSFTDLQSYLKSTIKLQFSNKHINELRAAYFLRNVIAPSAGFLRSEQLSLIPEGVDTEGSELRISQEYLTNLVGVIREAVSEFDNNVRSKFSPPKGVALPPEAPNQLESPRN
jgi:hypothetical protein